MKLCMSEYWQWRALNYLSKNKKEHFWAEKKEQAIENIVAGAAAKSPPETSWLWIWSKEKSEAKRQELTRGGGGGWYIGQIEPRQIIVQ